MKFIRFDSATPTDLLNAQAITGFTSAIWTERYARPGEFKLVAPLSSGLREFLPLGTVISHQDTLEFAIVEDHHIKEKVNQDPVLTITGRSFDSYLENRIVGMNEADGNPAAPPIAYELVADYTYTQAVELINDHLKAAGTVDNNNTLDNFIFAETTMTDTSGVSEARVIKRATVHKALLNLLKVDNLGVRTVRRNTHISGIGSPVKSYLLIHKGADKSNEVIFSWAGGALSGAEYLWSLKTEKNVALVSGRYVEKIVYTGPALYDRRVMLVDASDLDDKFDTVPTGTDLTDIRAQMVVRGEEALAAQNQVDIISADVAPITQFKYRTHYDIGDLVSVHGKYGGVETRRVVEHVEAEDANGRTSYPTLEKP